MKFTSARFRAEVLGWAGALAILTGYAATSLDWISARSAIYLILNIGGSLAIVYISLRKRAYQPAFLNIVWALISLFVIIRIYIL